MTSMARSLVATDPVAAIVSAAVAILGVLGVVDRLGLSGDDVAVITGAVMTIAATVRTVWPGRLAPVAKSTDHEAE